MNFIILGTPGSGKGTQAARFAEKCKLKHISTGDLLRDAVSSHTPLGKQVASTLAAGQLVADDIVLELIKEAIAGQGNDDGAGGWILDGFPRTMAQAEALEELLVGMGQEVDYVILLEVDPEVVIKRLSNRRTCRECKTVYNLLNRPPQSDGKCDECGGNLVQRNDDKPDTIRKRINIYQEETFPIVEYYEAKHRLKRIDGSKSIDEVADMISRLVSG